MGLLQKLLSAVGLRESSSGRGNRRAGDATVTVEHEPDASTESAVKGTGGVSEDTAASGSTGTITDTADEEAGATEPSEAASPTDHDDEVVADESAGTDAVEDETADEESSTAEETTTDDEPAGSDESPDVLNGIGPAYAERLESAGVGTVADLAAADAADLAAETDLGEGRIANWIEQAREY